MDTIIHYGRFKETLDKIVDLMQSDYPSSVILRGNPGSGKKTVIKEALKLTGVKCVFLSPGYYTDDYVALKALATELGYDTKSSSISDLVGEIRLHASHDNKLVIVLENFEGLCSQRQSLLYNLMNLIHTNPTKLDNGPNLTLIGLTSSLDWAENIEKRVRSRLNAKCIDLHLPYRNLEEYIEFASLLLGGHEIKGQFYEQFYYMYGFTNRSVRSLKKYLINVCSVDEKKKLKIKFDPENYRDDYQQLPNNLLRVRLRLLTKSQLDLLKWAVNYCYVMGSYSFTLADILRGFNDTQTNLNSSAALRDLAILVKLRLVKPDKLDQVISQEAVMFPAVTSKQFIGVLKGDQSLHNLNTDRLWKSLK